MINNSWILSVIPPQNLAAAQTEVARRLLMSTLALPYEPEKEADLLFVAQALQLAVYDLLEEQENLNTLRSISQKVFDILRVLVIPSQPIDAAKHLLNLACFGVLGERGADAARFLKENPWPELPFDSGSWGERVEATVLDACLRLIRKACPDNGRGGGVDLELVQQRILTLRKMQSCYEADYLRQAGPNGHARRAAWELVALYHLSKAAEILAIYSTQGSVSTGYDIQLQLEAQFDRALTACARAQLIETENRTRLLARTAQQLLEDSIFLSTIGAELLITSKKKLQADVPPTRTMALTKLNR